MLPRQLMSFDMTPPVVPKNHLSLMLYLGLFRLQKFNRFFWCRTPFKLSLLSTSPNHIFKKLSLNVAPLSQDFKTSYRLYFFLPNVFVFTSPWNLFFSYQSSPMWQCSWDLHLIVKQFIHVGPYCIAYVHPLLLWSFLFCLLFTPMGYSLIFTSSLWNYQNYCCSLKFECSLSMILLSILTGSLFKPILTF